MSPLLQLAFSLAVILAAAKLAGHVSTRLGQPSVLGELLAGVILGPSLLDLTHLPFITDAHLAEVLTQVGQLGVWLIMFMAGLDVHLSDLAANSRVSAPRSPLAYGSCRDWHAALLDLPSARGYLV